MSINYISIIFALLLLAVPFALVWQFQRSQLVRLSAAVGRMAVQTAVLGVLFWGLWHFNSLWLDLLWIVIASLAAAFALVRRTHLPARRLFLPVFAAMLLTTVAVSAYLQLAVLRPAEAADVRFLVPVASVLLAHILTTNIHGLTAYLETLRTDGQSYYTALGNGSARLRALSPYVGRALSAIVVPTSANLSVMGLYAVPLLLCGLLMGCPSPAEAVWLFVVLVVAGIAASMVSLVVTLWLVDRRVFSRRGQLETQIPPQYGLQEATDTDGGNADDVADAGQ